MYWVHCEITHLPFPSSYSSSKLSSLSWNCSHAKNLRTLMPQPKCETAVGLICETLYSNPKLKTNTQLHGSGLICISSVCCPLLFSFVVLISRTAVGETKGVGGGRGRRRRHFGHFSMTVFIKDILVHSRQKFWVSILLVQSIVDTSPNHVHISEIMIPKTKTQMITNCMTIWKD